MMKARAISGAGDFDADFHPKEHQPWEQNQFLSGLVVDADLRQARNRYRHQHRTPDLIRRLRGVGAGDALLACDQLAL